MGALVNGIISEHVDVDSHNLGILSVIEFGGLPFIPQRIFWVTDVPAGEMRGGHAHYKTEQILICAAGKILVKTASGNGEIKQELLKPGQYTYVGKMVWDEQIFMTGKDVLLVLASTSYDRNDYITTYNDYLSKFKK